MCVGTCGELTHGYLGWSQTISGDSMSSSQTQADDATTRESVFQFLVHYKRTHDGNTPTTREIADACCLSSTSSVRYHLLKLELENRIRTYGNRQRGIGIVGATWDFAGNREGDAGAATPHADRRDGGALAKPTQSMSCSPTPSCIPTATSPPLGVARLSVQGSRAATTQRDGLF